MDGTAYIGIGSNLGDRLDNMSRALDALRSAGAELGAVSSAYETAPMYIIDQPRFLNAAAEITFPIPPQEALELTRKIELQVGRRTTVKYGPRVIDIDLLLWGSSAQLVLEESCLSIPHPLLIERSFALIPLAEIAPDLTHPLSGRAIADHAAETDQDEIELFRESDWFLGYS